MQQGDGIPNSRSRGYLRVLLGNKKVELIRENCDLRRFLFTYR